MAGHRPRPRNELRSGDHRLLDRDSDGARHVSLDARGVDGAQRRPRPDHQRRPLRRTPFPARHLRDGGRHRNGPRTPALALTKPQPASRRKTEWVGIVIVLISATAFGMNAILAKLAYRSGLGITQTLAFRFLLGAAGMWVLAIALRQNPLRF